MKVTVENGHGPNMVGLQLFALLYPTDDMDVAVWSNADGVIQVEISQPGSGDSKVVTVLDE